MVGAGKGGRQEEARRRRRRKMRRAKRPTTRAYNIPQWVVKKPLALNRRDGLLGTSVRIEGDQASVVIPS